MPAGRPSNYDFELCKEICEQIADGDNIVNILHTHTKYPSWATFRKWKNENDELHNLYYSIPKMQKFKNRKSNRDKYKTNGKFDKNKYYRIKRKENPSERLRYSISSNIYQKIKENKKGSIIKKLPYSIEELKNHLEIMFQEGMTWDNYGEWHIDHIKPHSLFNYRSMDCDEFLKCWSLSNLQPLWGIDNIKKSNKYVNQR